MEEQSNQLRKWIRIVAIAVVLAVILIVAFLIGLFRGDHVESLPAGSSMTDAETGKDASDPEGVTAAEETEEAGPTFVFEIREGIDKNFGELVAKANRESRVLKSAYQDALGYSWWDLYTVLVSVNRHNNREYEPEFAVFRTWDTKNPFLYVGYVNPDGQDFYILYAYLDGNLYQLMTATGRLSYNPVANAFSVEGSGKLYFYRDRVLVECPDFLGTKMNREIVMHESTDGNHIVVEEFVNMVQDLREGVPHE